MPEIVMLTSAGQRFAAFVARHPETVIRALILLLLATTAAWAAGLLDRRVDVPISAIFHDGGHRFTIGLEGVDPPSWKTFLLHSRGADNAGFGQSALRLIEDGVALARPHSDHQSIQVVGEGRYSHWGPWLYFSSSDNTDPRMNGRSYTIEWSAGLHRVLALPLLVIGLLLASRAVRRLPEVGALVAALRTSVLWFGVTGLLSAYVLAVFAVGAPPVPIVNYDTGTYFSASHIVPLGYPAFLHGIFGLTGSLKAIVLVQVAVFCASVLALQSGLQKLTKSPAFAGLVGCILVMAPALTAYANNLLTEQLFTAMLLFHAAAAAWCFVGPSRAALLSLAVTAVLAVLLRPSGLFLYGGILYLLLFWHGRRIALLRWCIVPLIILSAANVAIDRAVHGSAPSIAGLALFPHVAHLYQGGGAATPAEEEALKTAIAPFALERAQAGGLEQQYLWELNNFNRLAHYSLSKDQGGWWQDRSSDHRTGSGRGSPHDPLGSARLRAGGAGQPLWRPPIGAV